MNCRKWEVQILVRHEGHPDQEAEEALSRHLEICVSCRRTAEQSAEIDRLLLESPAPCVPFFLNEKIASAVSEEMREDSMRSPLRYFIASFGYFRLALAGTILALGIGLGVLTGLNLSHSINTSSSGPSYDLLALAGIRGGESDSSLDFIWTDTKEAGR